jgi:hypothetical protein
MPNPDDSVLDQILDDFYDGVFLEEQPKAKEALLAWRDKSTTDLIDRLEQAIDQHTVPEGKHLITRSYVQNCLEFERQRIAKGGK